jgi:Protein of unknown function (DUF3732)
MKLDILQIILWSKGNHIPRRVEFRPGVVNIISGDSKTGKSAIIPIIDYCLGARSCAIPTGTIRDACAWFGLLIDTADGKKLLARQEPGGRQLTDNMFLLEGDAIDVPDRIERHNANASQIRALLNRISGTSNMDIEPDSQAIGSSRPSIRDFMAFVFQPQNVVANPDVFFFKADTTEHREKLKSIFPYVLGALDVQTLIDRARLDRLSKELKRKERELGNIRNVSARWQAEARSWLDRARELGLMPDGPHNPEDWPELLGLLRNIASHSSEDVRPSATAVDQALQQKLELFSEERRVAGDAFELRQRFNELKALKDTADAHGGALLIQKSRLSLSTWLKDLSGENSDHVLVDPRLSSTAELDLLCRALADVEADTRRRPASTETIDRELARVQGFLGQKLEELQAVRARLRAIEGLQQTPEPAYSIQNIERFLGQLQNAVETYDTIGSDSDLAEEVESLQEEVRLLQERVSEHLIRRRTEHALQIVQKIAAEIVPRLDCEFENLPIELSISELSIKVVGPERKDWLWEIGSGANWLAYHIAVTAALQRFFMKTTPHPVPHLLVYDQPSQVYFPRKLAVDREDDSEAESQPPLADKDIEAVCKVFAALSDEVEVAQGCLQVIVLDHAGDAVWGSVKNTNLVEEWREGRKLVPVEWIPGATNG